MYENSGVLIAIQFNVYRLLLEKRTTLSYSSLVFRRLFVCLSLSRVLLLIGLVTESRESSGNTVSNGSIGVTLGNLLVGFLGRYCALAILRKTSVETSY